MKKVLYAAILLFLPLSVFAAKRMVLGQFFTSTTCGPCVGGNAALDDVLAQRDTVLAVVRYHVNWPSPGTDPYYWYNVPAVSNRINMYSIDGVPTLTLDGAVSGVGINAVDAKAAVPTTIALALYRQFPVSALAANQGAGKVIVELYNEDTEPKAFILNGALTESDIHYTGPNGDPIHDQAMIDMLPNYFSGEAITLQGNERRILTYDFDTYDTITFPSISEPHLVDAGTCELVFWCQNATGKEIYQADKVKVVGLDSTGPGLTIQDIRVYDQTGDGKLQANEKAEVKVTLANNSSLPKEDVHVFLEITDKNITTIDGYAEIPVIAAGENYVVDTANGDGLLIKAGSGYKDNKFDITCKAGSGDGSWAVTIMPLGTVEKTGPDFSFSIPCSFVTQASKATLSLPEASDVRLVLFDACGRMTRTLFSGNLDPGTHHLALVTRGLPRGVYFVKALAGSRSAVEKLVLID